MKAIMRCFAGGEQERKQNSRRGLKKKDDETRNGQTGKRFGAQSEKATQ